MDLAVGYTRIYGSHIFWTNPSTPLAREVNPQNVYERLYRAGSVQNGDAAKMDTLLLDRVLGDAKRLRAEVGAADGARLDEYLSVMRSIGDPTRCAWHTRHTPLSKTGCCVDSPDRR